MKLGQAAPVVCTTHAAAPVCTEDVGVSSLGRGLYTTPERQPVHVRLTKAHPQHLRCTSPFSQHFPSLLPYVLVLVMTVSPPTPSTQLTPQQIHTHTTIKKKSKNAKTRREQLQSARSKRRRQNPTRAGQGLVVLELELEAVRQALPGWAWGEVGQVAEAAVAPGEIWRPWKRPSDAGEVAGFPTFRRG